MSSSRCGDWADPKAYLHDEVSTDRRDPTVNANGLIYGALELSADYLPVRVSRAAHNQPGQADRSGSGDPADPAADAAAFPLLGRRAHLDEQADVHNPMFDHKGRVWITSAVRAFDNPDFSASRARIIHPPNSFLFSDSSRHLALYDPKTQKLTHISTCFGTHHLMFAEDANHTLWTKRRRPGGGLANMKMFEETGDEVKVVGLDGTHHRHQRQRQARCLRRAEPAGGFRPGNATVPRSTRWPPRPTDRLGIRAWFPGAADPIQSGIDPPETTLVEVYEPPVNNPKASVEGFSPRAWTSIATASRGLRSPAGTSGASIAGSGRPAQWSRGHGQHCPEGWTLYLEPLPQMKGVTRTPVVPEASYYTWVESSFDTFGLGRNIPINTGNGAEDCSC